MRREETASTRSLLNTAKLMGRQRDVVETERDGIRGKIADKIGEITVNGNSALVDPLETDLCDTEIEIKLGCKANCSLTFKNEFMSKLKLEGKELRAVGFPEGPVISVAMQVMESTTSIVQKTKCFRC